MERIISLGKRIRELRMKKNLSQVELARGICTPSMVSQIESDRARPSYKILLAICDKLEVKIENILGDVELNAEYMSMYKMARAMRASKNYSGAIPLLQKLLEEPRASVSALVVKFDLAVCYFERGDINDAELVLHEIWDLAMVRQELEMAVHVSLYLGLIEMKRNHHALAVFHLEKAEERLGRSEIKYFDPEAKAKIYYWLAKTYAGVGRVAEAVDKFEKAATVLHECNSILELANVYAEMGWTYNLLRQFDKSSDYSDRSFALYEVLNQQKQMALLNMNRAVQLNDIGRHQESLSMMVAAIEHLQHINAMDDVGHAIVELAKIRLSIGEYELAEECCQTAIQLVDEQNVDYAWIHYVLAKVSLWRGSVDRAIDFYESASEVFKRTRSFSEWSDSMSELAQIHKDQNRPEKAIEILKSIRLNMQNWLVAKGIVL